MNKTILTVALAAALSASAYAQSPLSDLTVSGTFDYESQYVFRGKKITNSAFQPKAEFRYPAYQGNIYADIWTNQPIGRRGVTPGPNQANEIDLYGGYVYPLTVLAAGLSVDVGNTFYWYPEIGGNANALSRSDETYAGLMYDTSSMLPVNLSPSVYYFHDWILDQNVVEGSIKYTWNLSNMVGVPGITVVPRAYMGWLQANRSLGDQLNPGVPNWRNSYLYYGFMLDLNYAITKNASAFVGFRYAGNNDGTVFYPAYATTPQRGGTTDNMWMGAGLTFSN